MSAHDDQVSTFPDVHEIPSNSSLCQNRFSTAGVSHYARGP